MSNNDTHLLLTVEEVAQSCAVSQQTVRRWIASGYLPSVRLGPGKKCRVRVQASDLDTLIMGKKQKGGGS